MMIRLLRHVDSENREDDGAVNFEDLALIFRSRNYFFFALVNSNMAKLLAKRRWNEEKIPVFRGPQST